MDAPSIHPDNTPDIPPLPKAVKIKTSTPELPTPATLDKMSIPADARTALLRINQSREVSREIALVASREPRITIVKRDPLTHSGTLVPSLARIQDHPLFLFQVKSGGVVEILFGNSRRQIIGSRIIKTEMSLEDLEKCAQEAYSAEEFMDMLGAEDPTSLGFAIGPDDLDILQVVQALDLRLGRWLECGSKRTHVTTKERQVLAFLMARAQKAVTRDSLWRIWDAAGASPGPDSNVIDVYVSMVRKALKRVGSRCVITTLMGTGWVLEYEEDALAANIPRTSSEKPAAL